MVAILLLAFPSLAIYRYAAFAATVGGIEHDSGWYFGTARNLAQRGIYASSSNVAVSDEPVSRGTGFHNRPTVQDAEGYTYFPAGVTVGPGFIVPEALVLKVLGVGWWQYRLLPLSAMFCLVVLLSGLAYVRAGPAAVLVLQLWLWAMPPVTFNFAYEAYSEHLALLYSLLGFCAYGYAMAGQASRKGSWAMAGFLMGLSYLTKSLFLISSAAVVFHLAWRVRNGETAKKRAWLGGSLAAAGFLLPVATFEAYRFAVLVSRFGLHGYLANTADFMLVFLSGGSGLGSDLHGRLAIVRTKLDILQTIGLRVLALAWPLALGAAVFVFRRPQATERSTRSEVAGTVLQVAAIKIALVLTWFTFLTPSHFTRHAWDALILSALMISILVADSLRGLFAPERKEIRRPGCAGGGIEHTWALTTHRRSFLPGCGTRVLRWYRPFYRPLAVSGFLAGIPQVGAKRFYLRPRSETKTASTISAGSWSRSCLR